MIIIPEHIGIEYASVLVFPATRFNVSNALFYGWELAVVITSETTH